MDTTTEEELRMLRARAYGPAADIENDPTALRRLQQLEASRGGARATPAEVLAPVETPAPGVLTPEERDEQVLRAAEIDRDPDLDLEVFGSLSGEAAVVPPRPARRRTKVLWALSVLASAALAASVTYAVVRISPVATSAGTPQIAALDATSTAEIPSGWFGAGPSSAVFDFFGLTIVQSNGAYGGGAGATAGGECLTIVRTDQVPEKEDFDPSSWGFDGQVYSGCGIGAFPATVEVPINSDSPRELSTRFPSGSALQFVLDGDRVGVFLDSE